MKKTQFLDARRNIRKEFVAFISIVMIGLLAALAYLGIVYSAGVVFFALGASKRWMHGIFHLFCLAGTVLQFVGVFFYVL